MSEPQKPLPTTKRIDACIATATNILGLSDYRRDAVHDLSTIARAYVTGDLVRPDTPAPAPAASPLVDAGAALPIVVKVSDEHANAFSKLSAEQRKEVMGKLRSGTHGGIIFLPEEMDGPAPDFDSPAFVEALMETMKVPIIIQAPANENASASGAESESAAPTLIAGSSTVAGGWCAPSDQIYSVPEVTVNRGGISFTAAPIRKESKTMLRARVKNLMESLQREKDRNDKLRRRNRRLRKFIEGA